MKPASAVLYGFTNLLHKLLCCFPLSSCLTSQCSWKRFISVWNSSQLYSRWKKVCTIAFCLASNLLVFEGFLIWDWFAFQNTNFKKLLLFVCCFSSSSSNLAAKCKCILQASVPGQTAFLETFWLKVSAETHLLRVEVPCFQSSTVIMIYSNQLWCDSFIIHKWVFFCYGKIEVNR